MRAVIWAAACLAVTTVAGADNPGPSPKPSATPTPASRGAARKPAPATAKPSPVPSPSPTGKHVYSNDDLPGEPAPIASPGHGGRGSVTVLPGEAAPAAAAPSEPLAPDATDAYWRERADQIRANIGSAEQRVTEAQARIDALRNDRGVNDTMAADREQNRQGQIAAAQADLDRARAEVEAARQAMSSLEEEARRKSIPPGWLRPR
jgi:hypothetical protein